MNRYITDKENLNKAIDIAISVIQSYPPKGFSKENIDQFLNAYLDFKHLISNPLPNFDNAKSLLYIKEDVLTYFQEETGETVNHFWKKMKAEQVPFIRENKLKKILSRNKIKNDIEYNFIIDVLQPYIQSGILNKAEIESINDMIIIYEKKKA